MDTTTLILAGAALVLAIALALVAWRAARGGGDARAAQLAETVDRLAAAQAEQAGRLQQLAETQSTAHAQMNRTLEERLEALSKRLGDGLAEHTNKTGETMSKLHERLALIDAAQKNIAQLSEQVVSLQDVLANKQARGAFGEIQLNDLVTAALPPNAYGFQVKLSTGRIVDCLLQLPNPPGPIAIDAKFPLESYRALREAADDQARLQAGRTFAQDVRKHVQDIAEKYIVPGETAESALMFLPSEAVYAELHANFRNVVEESFKRRVWIVSPTTLMATLNTVRAVLKDARMREQAGVIQSEVLKLLQDVGRLDDRVAKLQRDFERGGEDIRQIRISTEKISKRAEHIEDIQLGADGESPAGDLAPSGPALEKAEGE